MNIFEELEKEKKELEKYLDVKNFNQVKTITLLRFLKNKLLKMENIFTKKEIVGFLNKAFDVEIKYSTYCHFSKNHLVQNQNKGVNKTDSKDKVSKINEVSTSEETPVDNKKDSESISHKPAGVKINIDIDDNDYGLKKADKSSFILE